MQEYQEYLIKIFRKEYLCPISNEVIKNPFMDVDGVTYEQSNICNWLQQKDVSPVTGESLKSKKLIENCMLKDLIERVETEVPRISTMMKLLKSQIECLKLQNQGLKEEMNLRCDNEENWEQDRQKNNERSQMQRTEPITESNIQNYHLKQIVLRRMEEQQQEQLRKTKQQLKYLNYNYNSQKLTMMQNEDDEDNQKEAEQSEQEPNQKNQTHRVLSKTKMIKKHKFQKYYDFRMGEICQQQKESLLDLSERINLQNSVTIRKLQNQLKNCKVLVEGLKMELQKKEDKVKQLNIKLQDNRPEKKIMDKLNEINEELTNKILLKRAKIEHIQVQNLEKPIPTIAKNSTNGNYQNCVKIQNQDQLPSQNRPQIRSIGVGFCNPYNFHQNNTNSVNDVQKMATSNYQQEISRLKNQLKEQRKKLEKIEIQHQEKLKQTIIQQRQTYQEKQKQLTLKYNQELKRQSNLLSQELSNKTRQLLNRTKQEQGLYQKLKKKEIQLKKVQKKQIEDSKNYQSEKNVNQELSEIVIQLKKTLKQSKNNEKQFESLRQLNDILVNKIEQNHKNEVKTQFQITSQANGYKKERDNLLGKLQSSHQSWMFIFSVYQAAINEFMKQNYHMQTLAKDMKNNVDAKKNEGLYMGSNGGQKKSHSRIEQKPVQMKSWKDSSQSQYQTYNIRLMNNNKNKQSIDSFYESVNPPNNVIPNAIVTLEKAYQVKVKERIQKKMIAEQEQKEKLYVQTKQNKLKSEINSRIYLIEIMLNQKIRLDGIDINAKNIKETRHMYKKLSLLSKGLRDQTPWNFWSLYKYSIFYHQNENRNIEYGLQIDCGSLVSIITNYGETTIDWSEVKFLRSKNKAITDKEWKVLAKYGDWFPNVVEIDLENNKITTINKEDFDHWRRLAKVNLDKNPLTQISIKKIEKFTQEKPNVVFEFTK